MDSQILLAAARFERDRRAERYPQLIHDCKTAPGETIAQLEERLTLDYQCWVAIAEWFETDRFASFSGGAEPDRPDAPIVRWPELETAAVKALEAIAVSVAKAERGSDPEALVQAYVRRARLICIHRAVQLRRQTIDAVNRELHADRQAVAA